MNEPPEVLTAEDRAYYQATGPFTQIDGVDPAALPDDVGALVEVVQGLLIHRAWLKAYGIDASQDRLPEEGLHAIPGILHQARALHDAPLTEPRPPGQRVLANCRHFSTMLASFLKFKGVPARARCGFATYFEPGKYVDHWVCEYWHEGDGRWRMVDAQLDPLQRGIINPDFDTLDVPVHAFWVGGKAWQACHAGDAEPERFGIMDMWGLWYVCGNLALDVVSLDRIELLPWDAAIIAKQIAATDDADILYERMASLSLRAAEDASAVRDFYDQTLAVQVSADTTHTIATADAKGAGTGINPLAR